MTGMNQSTIDAVRTVLAGAPLEKAFTFQQPSTATTGLQNYDLEPVVRNFTPQFSPIRNRTPRVKARGGSQANWKAVIGVDTGMQYAGIEEGRRGGLIDTISADYYAAYRTIGREANVTFEADLAAEGFDDVKARAVMNLLTWTMQEEEKILLGGNSIHPLGQTATPTLTASTSGGTGLSATTAYDISCVALTYDAWRRLSARNQPAYSPAAAVGITQTFSRANQDGGANTVVNGGTALPSAIAQITTGSGATCSITAKVVPLRGAYAYAWYIGTAAAGKFHSVTTCSTQTFAALPAGGNQAFSALAATDYSADGLIHDGLLGFIGNSALNSYYNAVTPGATLTPDGQGGIVELDNMLRYYWDSLRALPDRLTIGSQEAISIKRIITQAGSATSLARFNFQIQDGKLVGGALPRGYLCPFGDQREIPFEQHPFMVPGTILASMDSVPYPMNNVGNMTEVQCRQDYWQTEWPLRTRAYEFGVYSDQVYKHYFPPSLGVITNLSPNGT